MSFMGHFFGLITLIITTKLTGIVVISRNYAKYVVEYSKLLLRHKTFYAKLFKYLLRQSVMTKVNTL